MADQFPAEQQRIIRGLEVEIERLKTSVRQFPALAITRASGAFNLPEASPGAPASGVTAYGSSGKFTVKYTSGSTTTIPAANVSNPPNFGSPSSQSGDFASASAYTQLRADCAALHDTVRDLCNALRNAGLMA